MRSVKTLIFAIMLAIAAPKLRAQDAAGAAQQVRRSAEQAAQTTAPANKPASKPAAQAPNKPTTPAASNSSSASKAAAKPATQSVAAGKPGATTAGAAKSATPLGAKPAAQSAKAPSGANPHVKSQAAGTKKAPTKKPGVKRAAKPKSSAAENAQARLEHESQTRIARRDPFEAMLGRENAGSSGPKGPLPPGKAGLQVSTLRLDGVVRAPNGMIAVVSNPQSRTYFLREGDQLYDGRVEKIAMDGVSFHEVGKDAFGKPVERQVNKRIYASAGEQQ
jgi:Tfp pilus assembly protein PilP